MNNNDNHFIKTLIIVPVIIFCIIWYAIDQLNEEEKREEVRREVSAANYQEIEKQKSIAKENENKQRTIISDFAVKCDDNYVIGRSFDNKIYYKSQYENMEIYTNFLITDKAYIFANDLKKINKKYILHRKNLNLETGILINGEPLKIESFGYSGSVTECVLLGSLEGQSKFEEFLNEIKNNELLEEQERQRIKKIRDDYNNTPNKI
jgi:hypothetical protein